MKRILSKFQQKRDKVISVAKLRWKGGDLGGEITLERWRSREIMLESVTEQEFNVRLSRLLNQKKIKKQKRPASIHIK